LKLLDFPRMALFCRSAVLPNDRADGSGGHAASWRLDGPA
jgi:hypothetical protein